MMHSEYFETFEFIRQGGPISIAVALILAIMSIGSWTVLVIKAVQARWIGYKSRGFLDRFWSEAYANTLAGISFVQNSTSRAACANDPTKASSFEGNMRFPRNGLGNRDRESLDNPFARIATAGLQAAARRDYRGGLTGRQERGFDELIAGSLRQGIDQEAVQLESGLTLLASIGSLAPFVGLFGTVCGIYHALGRLAEGSQSTIDQVAGPVGEALIMTAFGLAVALPAVLAYNCLLRENRLLMLKIEGFAQQLYSLLIARIAMEVPECVVARRETASAEA